MTHSIAWDKVTDADVVRALEEYDRLGADQFFLRARLRTDYDV